MTVTRKTVLMEEDGAPSLRTATTVVNISSAAAPNKGQYLVAVDDHTAEWGGGTGHNQNTDTGTTSPTFQLDTENAGPKAANVAGTLTSRNAANTMDAPLAGSVVTASDSIQLTPKVLGAVVDGRMEYGTDGALHFNSSGTNSGGVIQPQPRFGPYASMPTSGMVAGDMYIVANPAPTVQWIYDGAEWRPLIGGVMGYKPRLAGSFTAKNPITQTLVDVRGGLLYTMPHYHLSALCDFSIAFSTSTMFVEGAFNIITPDSSATYFGIQMLEFATGRAVGLACAPGEAGTPNSLIEAEVFDAYARTSRVHLNPGRTIYDAGAPFFYRLKRTGANIVFALSRDRFTWVDIYSIASNVAFLSEPTHLGIYGIGYAGISQAVVTHFTYGN